MKSVICQLAWKLRTSIYFCHSILIFKIILVFKIMIVIRFQIWFLIKFKLQKREWVWLKLCFSHAKGLWHYKYRPQWCKRGGGEKIKKTLEGNKHKKTPRGGHYKREQKKKNQEQREERLKREGGEHSLVGACTVAFAFAFAFSFTR